MIEDRINPYNIPWHNNRTTIDGFEFNEAEFLKGCIPDYKTAKELAIYHLVGCRFKDARQILMASRRPVLDNIRDQGNNFSDQDNNFYELIRDLAFFGIYHLPFIENGTTPTNPDEIKTKIQSLLGYLSIKKRELKREDQQTVDDFFDSFDRILFSIGEKVDSSL